MIKDTSIMTSIMTSKTIRTTVTLPAELVAAADQMIKAGKAKSRNEFFTQALQREIAAVKRAEIDAELSEMAQDPEYQAQVMQLEAEFAAASWEAFQLKEK